MKESGRSLEEEVEGALLWLKRHGSKRTRDGMVRYAIPSTNALGVAVSDIRALAKQIGRNHELALALWKTGIYEARMLTAFIAEPARVTSAQMDRWCRDFDSWAICDTLCFHLFDRTPHAFAKVKQWSDQRPEFQKRAAFALLASLAGHDKTTGDRPFLESLRLIELAAADERNFVKKGVNWALRGVGRRNRALHAAAVKVARRLAGSEHVAARWVGKDALKKLTSPNVLRRLKSQRSTRLTTSAVSHARDVIRVAAGFRRSTHQRATRGVRFTGRDARWPHRRDACATQCACYTIPPRSSSCLPARSSCTSA